MLEFGFGQACQRLLCLLFCRCEDRRLCTSRDTFVDFLCGCVICTQTIHFMPHRFVRDDHNASFFFPSLAHRLLSPNHLIRIIKNLPMPMRRLDYRLNRFEIFFPVSLAYINKTKSKKKGKGVKQRTDIRPKVRRRVHLDVQIPVHLANDLDRVVDSEVAVLDVALAVSIAFLSCGTPIIIFSFANWLSSDLGSDVGSCPRGGNDIKMQGRGNR